MTFSRMYLHCDGLKSGAPSPVTHKAGLAWLFPLLLGKATTRLPFNYNLLLYIIHEIVYVV